MPDIQQKEQLDLLRFVDLLDQRIARLEASLELHSRVLLSQGVSSALGGKQSSDPGLVPGKSLYSQEPEDGRKEWLHISECAKYYDLPQPSTIHAWMRKGILVKDEDYQKIGPRGKVFVNATRLVAKKNNDRAE